MNKINSVAIIGLGLIGSSIAKALRYKSGINSIIGVDINADYVDAALKDNVISIGASWDSAQLSALQQADVVFICTPLSSILDVIAKILPHIRRGCIITDTCSVKASIVYRVASLLNDRAIFIGGHPMAGTERSGYYAGSSRLLENAYYVLTPSTSCSRQALDNLSSLIRSIGAIPIIMAPQVHDQVVAAISHLPHVLASALLHSIEGYELSEYMKTLAASAFRDMTRIAASNPVMWRDICLANAPAVADTIDSFIEILSSFRAMLEDSDAEGLLSFFADAGRWRSSMPIVAKSTLYPTFNIIVDVEDKPGIIGQIATLLGQHNINIKNIGILNNREDKPGALQIALADKDNQRSAMDILQQHGFKAFID